MSNLHNLLNLWDFELGSYYLELPFELENFLNPHVIQGLDQTRKFNLTFSVPFLALINSDQYTDVYLKNKDKKSARLHNSLSSVFSMSLDQIKTTSICIEIKSDKMKKEDIARTLIRTVNNNLEFGSYDKVLLYLKGSLPIEEISDPAALAAITEQKLFPLLNKSLTSWFYKGVYINYDTNEISK